MTDKCLYIRVLYILFIRKHFRENIRQLEDVLKHRIYHRQELLDSCLKTLFSVSNSLKEYSLSVLQNFLKTVRNNIGSFINFDERVMTVLRNNNVNSCKIEKN